MTKTKWDKMNTWQKNALVLTTLWKAENGKPIDIKWNREGDEVFYGEYIQSGKPWKTHEIDAVVVPSFTTARNDCALVIAAVKQRGKGSVQQMILMLAKEEGLLRPGGKVTHTMDSVDPMEALWCGINANPDTICYCAVKAVEDE